MVFEGAEDGIIAALGAVAFIIELLAALVIVGATVRAVIVGGRSLATGGSKEERVRIHFVQALVFSLELFVAADLIKTIVTPTLDALAVLGAIIIVRTILVLALERELRQGSFEPAADS